MFRTIITKTIYEFCIENEDMKHLLDEWDYTENEKLGFYINEIGFRSSKKVWWICDKGHKWNAFVSNRTKGKGCPYCKNQKVLTGYNDLATTNPALAKEWSSKNKIPPTKVVESSGKKVWWKGNCGHEWQATIVDRKRGTGCPVCSNKKIVEGINDFPTTCPELLKYWDFDKNTVPPTEVSKCSKSKYYWIKDGISYYNTPSNARQKYKIL